MGNRKIKKRFIALLLCILTVFSSVCLFASCDTDLLTCSETTGLFFFPLPNGTFGIKAGTTLYLESVALPIEHSGRNVTEILPGAFEGAYNLKSITVPKYVTNVGDNAFADCVSLTSVVLPATVTNIGKEAFSDCPKLTDIKFAGTEEQWNAITKGEYWDSSTGNYTVTYNYAEQ